MGKMYRMKLDLHLFGEEGAAETGESNESVTDSTGEATENATENPSGNAEETSQPELTESEYREFKKKYKDLYDKDVQGIVKNRLGKFKKLETEHESLKKNFESQEPILNLLKERFGTEDLDELSRELENQLVEKLAYDKELDPDVIRENRRREAALQQERAKRQQLEKEQADLIARQEAQKKAQEWHKQADTLKETYPDFDIQEWSNNELFMTMLRNGFSVQQAYEAADLDNVKKMISQQTEQNTANSIRAGRRPNENASRKSSHSNVKKSVKEMSSKDIREMERRALNGEEVSF